MLSVQSKQGEVLVEGRIWNSFFFEWHEVRLEVFHRLNQRVNQTLQYSYLNGFLRLRAVQSSKKIYWEWVDHFQRRD